MSEPIRVLVVDDNPDHRSLAAEFLALAGEFAVEGASDLHELWDRLSTNVYDIVLLDYSLPDGNGLQGLAELAARGYRLPAIMLTGRGDERIAVQAIQAGAVDYLVKTGDYLHILPALLEKAVRTYALTASSQRSLEKIRYQALLLNNVNDAVVGWDLLGQITFWNRAAEELLGWSAPERLGQLVDHCYLSAFTPAIELPAAGEDGRSVERRGRRRNGTEIWLNSRVTALHDEAGMRLGYMDVSRDITERKLLEGRMHATQAQLAQSTRMAAIGSLASGVAHQISNPLTTIIAEAQLLRRTPDEGCRESAQAIEQAGWRAQAAVQRLIELSQPAALEPELVSINQTIENALSLAGAHVEAMGVRVELKLDPGDPRVRGNPRQLEDLWNILLTQAHEAAVDNTQHCITVSSARGAAGEVVVRVHDDGRVIPPERQLALFEPGTDRGSGYELSICREIVRQHGGGITVESTPLYGTTLTVSFRPEVSPCPTP